tara:strand:- start:5900 stop:8023 length:2124 start_codon:yes stop_codon:yes gene_type:complete
MSLVPVQSASSLEAETAKNKALSDKQQQNPIIQELAAHCQTRWGIAKNAKLQPEIRLLSCLRQRNGEYDPDKLAAIRSQSGSEIFMMLTSTKCRGASSWLRDTLLGSGTDKPWAISATPIPDLPPDVQKMAQQAIEGAIQMYEQSSGQSPTQEQISQEVDRMHDAAMRHLKEISDKRVERMELKMEDQLVEGHYRHALSEFIDDIVTFPTAILKGPVLRKRKTLQWQGNGLVPVEKIVPEWERVDPFNAYPSPWSASPHDGFFIERHKLTREDLEAMIGVEGFSEPAIRTVLADFGSNFTEMLYIDQAVADVVDKPNAEIARRKDVVDAIQLWDSVQGSKLLGWDGGKGVDGVTDPQKSYPCEVWMVGSMVIKAVLNYDPLGRKPYYIASYEKVPGAFWGNGVADLIKDCQAMCNAAARALANNMGISSGPQVAVNTSRMAPGEIITSLYPWKLWQFQNSDYQDNSKPIDFFQPQSNAQELMGVFEKFQTLADEYSGIPRYMTGENTPGAGRTASGLSMMISNASKSIKSVIASIDENVLSPLLQRLYQYNLRYSQDPELIGDINIIATGAMSLVAKESAAVRRTEFLQLVLTNQTAAQIVGPLGIAELLRAQANLLDLNVDNLVPTRDTLMQQQKQAEQQAQQAQQMQQQAMMDPQYENVQFEKDNNGAVTGAKKVRSREMLPGNTAPAGGRDSSLVANAVTRNSN